MTRAHEPSVLSDTQRRRRVRRAAAASSHAKVILLGEHAVVHGAPAVVLPVHGLSLTVEIAPSSGPITVTSELYSGRLDHVPAHLAAPREALVHAFEFVGAPARDAAVTVTGSIPPERGLGSSAAVAAALSRAVARYHGVELSADDHFELIQAAERVAHGTPSGLDARGVVAATPVWFERQSVTALPVRLSTSFVVADTGTRGRTREAVDAVRQLRRRDPQRVDGVVAAISAETTAAVDDLAHDQRVELGRRMSTVHGLLSELDVSSHELDRLVGAAMDAGALGAKLTGGGRGGCVLALAGSHEQAAALSDALTAAGAQSTWTIRGEELAP